jgi:DNA polymerase-3 subunit delta
MSVELKKLLSLDKAPKIIFIYGAEEFIIEQSLNKILNKFYPNRNTDYNFNKFHSDEIDLINVLDYCNSYSMLSEENVVLLKDFEKYFKGRRKKNDPKLTSLLNYLNDPSETTVFVITCLDEDLVKGKAKVNAEPYKTLIQKSYSIPIPVVYSNSYNSWVSNEFRSRNKSISEKGIYLILSQTQQNLRDIYNQIDKIDAYFSNSNEIPDDEIVSLLGQSRDYNIFELKNAVSKRNINSSLEICQNILKSSDEPISIVANLFNFFKNLLKYYEASQKSYNKYELAKIVNVNYNYLSEFNYAARQYHYKEVENILIYLCDYDRILKTSSPNSLVLMTELLTKIIGAK